MEIQSAFQELHAAASAVALSQQEPVEVRDTPEYEDHLAVLLNREERAVVQLAQMPSLGLADLFAKIEELARWRAQVEAPHAFCAFNCCDPLLDSIIADAKRLSA